MGIKSLNNNSVMPETPMRLPDCKRGESQQEDEEAIIGYDALYDSMERCMRGVSWKASVAHFVLNAPEEVLKLETQLKDGSYKPRPPKHFTVTSPKPREISSIAFRDRVYQRSLNDNALYPAMTKSFVYDNWACQKGKGTDGARNRLAEFLRQYYRKHGANGYIAQFDIRGYYPNMDHAYIEGCFRRKLGDAAYKRTLDVLHMQYPGEKGYNPGSQMIQITGISAMDGLDHYIKEQLHIRWYIRYMDDFILICDSMERLEECKEKIETWLTARKFELNPEKTRIYPISDGITFLGFRFLLTDTGKVLRFVRPENVKAKRKNLRRLVTKSRKGLLPKKSVDESYRSWRDHAAKGNSYKLLRRMDKYYIDLWRDCDAENHQKTMAPEQGGGDQPAPRGAGRGEAAQRRP